MTETVDREAIRARARASRLATCKYWRGALAQPPCGAGVDLVARVGPRRMAGWALRIPCCDAAAPVFACERKCVPTPEEDEARQRAIGEMLALLPAVMTAIPSDKSITHGEVPCPKCGGPVRWERSPVNGHLRGGCAAGCVSFIQ
ncbi:hypothetical protein [Methylobacterium aquaticum]|uniref:Uncharacterized protein n=1 Tax=Methylobacterium aquaticum TaxID=270351 RepID=A0A0J6S531_9HYPH|nr:hypothetical protein [Methylobacterium aquaticum]KMO28558.1 hypothetical protein VP06_27175 [Methylobacterium aquaticum]